PPPPPSGRRGPHSAWPGTGPARTAPRPEPSPPQPARWLRRAATPPDAHTSGPNGAGRSATAGRLRRRAASPGTGRRRPTRRRSRGPRAVQRGADQDGDERGGADHPERDPRGQPGGGEQGVEGRRRPGGTEPPRHDGRPLEQHRDYQERRGTVDRSPRKPAVG